MGLGFFWIGWDLSHMGFGIFKTVDLLMTLFYLVVDFNPNAVFELPGIDLYNMILISTENNGIEKFDLQYTKRPKLWRLYYT